MGGSPSQVVMGGDSCPKGCEFESRHQILDAHFFTNLFVVKFVMCVWKDENKWIRGRGWPIKRKKKIHNYLAFDVLSISLVNKPHYHPNDFYWYHQSSWALLTSACSGQSYKGSTIVKYDSRVVIWYFQVRYDSRVVIYDRRAFIRLTTDLKIPHITFLES